ncbi:sulfotransferase family protein [Pseudomonas sp. CFBP 13711]|uniref:sulfotransferase-like domain-containing protein n=1 Tax=unclassified Pseudomonas TaxID=196821 RepID=UPI001783E5FA|nr:MULTISPECIES: sulfotransferase family protein [unclassified Pseudomonas]MBD8709289.1 sulfotransferase family protein [Pseudomonas sp. CFBP 13711]MBD8714325.1 sulfotransferase family protein [Pseudomonas sp. CFBP 13715]
MNRMIGLWAHPRSRSTALERVFIERGDFEVFHEPFSHMAFDEQSAIPHGDLNCGMPRDYESIKALLRDTRQRAHVFHKDMAYHCLDRLKADAEFLTEQQNVFIIRDPARAILSHHAIFPQMPAHAIGHQALYEIFREVRRLTGHTPCVINAEDLASHPEHTVRRLCDHLQLDFMPQALSWSATCPEQWKAWRSWHKEAENSTRIMPGSADFDERPLHANPHLMTYYQLHRPFYERMNQFTEQGQP